MKRLGVSAGLIALVCASLATGNAAAKTIDVTPGNQEIGPALFEVGSNGHVIVGWSPVQEAVPKRMRRAAAADGGERASVRIRLPRASRFERVRMVGRSGSSGVNVGVSRNGLSLVSWTEGNGSIRVSRIGRKGRWSKPQTVFGKGTGYGNLSVGPDGTAAIYAIKSIRRGSVEQYIKSKKMFVSVRPPGGRFGKPRLVSRGGGTIGNYADVEAGTRGRVTVTWSGWCPLGPSRFWEPARVVDIAGKRVSRPRVVPNSKCPTFGMDLEGRPGKSQFLLIDGSMEHWNGVRVAARPAGKKFRRARPISKRGTPTLGAELSVSRKGRATVIWGFSENSATWDRTGYQMSRLRARRKVPAPSRVPGVDPDHFLLASAGAPGGRVAMVWQHLAPPDAGPEDRLTWMSTSGLTGDGSFSRRNRFTPMLRSGALHNAEIAFSTEGRRYILWGERGSRGETRGLSLTGP